jgi:acyl-coenzyme A synthetase/AMP-(fatty) acid ligase
VPARIIVIDDLPRTEAGKIDKNLLRQAVADPAEPRLANG